MVNPRWELRRSVASAALIVELGNEYGVSTAELLNGTRIKADWLQNPALEITGYQELRLVSNLLARLRDVPGLGLRAGIRYRVSTHGIWGFAAMSSPTVREAVNVLAAYPELSYSFSVISIEIRHGSMSMILDDHDVPAEIRQFNAERDFGIVFSAVREFLPAAFEFGDVRVASPEPAHAHLYPELLGITPRFSASRNEIRLPTALLDVPMPQANPHVAAMCTEQAAQLLNRRRERLGTAGAVRSELLRTRRFTTDQDDVAKALNMSVRTLRRRLTDEGTSYREIVAETAALLAEELLASGLTVSDVAHRLGYSGSPAFTEAFRHWEGTTPGAFARQHVPH